ncbi:MAG: Ig-like domain-containing protein [Hyphomicrobium sp.]|jgi:Ca2+-binding RTX toxin-like protein|nr:Ig-like domain-containing protein [Hyphomicrobium sp.]
MSNIRIERVPIQQNALWIIRADHLMLTFQQDPLDDGEYQDRWWVMEGTRDLAPDGEVTIGVDGANGVTTLSAANGNKDAAALLKAISTPWWRGSHIIPSNNPLSDWLLMASIARNIDAEGLPYHAFNVDLSPLPTANSSSVVASLLYYIGIDIAQNMPSAFLSFTVGTRTLLGTSQADQLKLEWSFDTILSGDGDDKLQGTDRPATVEKFYGGSGDDEFLWSQGSHVYHGGQPGLAYGSDGFDTVDYTAIGFVRIEAPDNPVPHLRADFLAFHATGIDRFFSVDAIKWNDRSDTISLGDGVDIVEFKPLLDLKGQEKKDNGDTLDLSDRTRGLMVAPSDEPDVVLVGSRAADGNFADGGLWARSLEWLIGSAGDDRIYTGPAMTGAEGGKGDDLISGRLSTPLTGASSNGFDIELLGGDGNDTIVSGTGRSQATGGKGADVFVLSSLSAENRITEFVITDADTADRLFVPYNFLIADVAGFAGSLLFPILGAITPVIGGATFAHLPQNPGPGPTNGYDSPGFFYLASQVPMDGSWDGSWNGFVNINDLVLFNRDGDDLLIHVYGGGGEAFTDMFFTVGGQDYTFQELDADPFTEAVIRVVDFQEGMLGINFYELGEETPFPFPGGDGDPNPAKLWNTVEFARNGDTFLRDPLEAEPEAPHFNKPDEGQTDERQLLSGTDGNDVLIAAAVTTSFSSGSDMSGGAGDDELQGGSGDDVLDGGSGTDVMSGGRGDDRYVVDTSADVVLESANSGIDTVLSSVSYVLPGNVENLTLTKSGAFGDGNALGNRITGSDGSDTLRGFQGNDTLFGGPGNDVLDGGAGNDCYVYSAGDGDDIIRSTDDPGGVDTLALIGFGTPDVKVFEATNGSDAILRLGDGARIVLEGFFSGGSINAAGFEDGTIWNTAFLTAAARASGMLVNDAPIARDDDGLMTFFKDLVISKDVLLANDRDLDGDGITIVGAVSRTAGADVTVTGSGDVRVRVQPAQTGVVTFEYTVSDGRGGQASAHVNLEIMPNEAPVASAPLQNHSVQAGRDWSYTLPAGAFIDPDGHSLSYDVSLADGSALPGWLTYNSQLRSFSGTPPEQFNGTFSIRVTASDGVAQTSATFDLTVTGRPPGATFTGTGRPDLLIGGEGDDILIGLAGNDTMRGGRGDDTFLVKGFAGFDYFNGGEGFDVIRGYNADDIIALMGDGNIPWGTLPGSSTAGPPRLDNLSGIEEIDGGDGYDVLRFEDSGVSYDFSFITITGIELIAGSQLDDWIIGSAGDDVIDGGRGQDVLFGGSGNDTFRISGLDNRDRFDGGNGHDTILGTGSRDVLQLRNAARDLVSIEAINMGLGNDVLQLSSEDDEIDLSGISVTGLERIEGLTGNDRIRGSSSNEELAGGTGRDVFVFAGEFGHDKIVDFQRPSFVRGGDLIDLSAFRFAAFAQVLDATRQIGADSVVSIESTSSSVTISNISKSLLKADFFIL